MLDILQDTLLDGLKLFPFLLVTYLLMEYLEHKSSSKSISLIEKSGKLGPLWGSLLGSFPQCGFSVASSNLYASRIISLGTLIAIYLSTSDEMLAVMLSEQVSLNVILPIIGLKVLIGMISGFVIDFLFRKKKTEEIDASLCDKEHCHCEENILVSSLKHTFNTFIFIFLITFTFNMVIYFIGEDHLKTLLSGNMWFGPFLTSLIGLIPNCASSVVITELFLTGVITLGSTVAGLLTGSGVALAVLIRNNKNMKENLLIITLLYVIGVISGLIINLF